jgi:hypothetical protein
VAQKVEHLPSKSEAESSITSTTKTNNYQTVKHWWLTSIILATKEAEIRRIEVRSQPGQ